MFVWCALLFVLGILAFMDSLLNYGEIFRMINSVIFMLVALGLLVRTSMKIKQRTIENLVDRVQQLEAILGPSAPGATEQSKRPVKQSIF
ncbi:MAG: hypothetical protein GX409_12480 [candidate division Zixibacteria bacterium]|jgi:cytochrome c oxidase subunit IV|nr:hypothetical protein [candidate division Zixibacteria bacterium]